MKLSPNANVFCNTPWYEAHIYWDGSLGICCQESQKLSNDIKYNIRNMSLTEWYNSQPVKDFRKSILSEQPTNICSRCYVEEAVRTYSRRHRSNQKSVLFNVAFEDSYYQSPSYPHFKFSQDHNGETLTLPIDLHVDLGNYCNLACKMCHSKASSTIAVQNVKWGIESDRQFLGNDWTKDPVTWNKFLKEILEIPKLKNIHFMGGETLLTKRFEEFVDYMIDHKRFDLCFSFVSNGTVYNQSLINKLKKFSRVGIEISLESTTEHNSYIRQGTDTNLVLQNLEKYKQECTNSTISITIRPAINALSLGYYYTLLDYCLENQFLVKSLIVVDPVFFQPTVIPRVVRQQYKNNYQTILDKLNQLNIDLDYNESDPNNYQRSIKSQVVQALNLIDSPDIKNQDFLLKELVAHCLKWDKVYHFNARALYPELENIFKENGYE